MLATKARDEDTRGQDTFEHVEPVVQAGLLQAMRSAKKPPFRKTAILNSGLDGWITNLPASITAEKAALPANRKAYLDEKERSVAVQVKNGYKITDQKLLTDEMIQYIVDELKEKGALQVKGSQELCERVERIALASGAKITHEYQAAAADKVAAEQRTEQRKKDVNDYANEQHEFAPR